MSNPFHVQWNLGNLGIGLEQNQQPSEPSESTIRSRINVCKDLAKDIEMPAEELRDLLQTSWASFLETLSRKLGPPAEDEEAKGAAGRSEEASPPGSDEALEKQRASAKAIHSKLSRNDKTLDKIVKVLADAVEMLAGASDVPPELAASLRDFDKTFRVLKELHKELLRFMSPVCTSLGVVVTQPQEEDGEATEQAQNQEAPQGNNNDDNNNNNNNVVVVEEDLETVETSDAETVEEVDGGTTATHEELEGAG